MRVVVEPQLLVWARETAGLPLDTAAGKVGLRDTKTATAVQKLEAMESGAARPSRSTLLEMARHYRRPLIAFYLSRPPATGDRGVDFRTLESSPEPAAEGLRDALVRRIRARQGMVRDLLFDDEDSDPLPFIGSHAAEDGESAVLTSLKRLLDTDLESFRREKNARAAFDFLRRRLEAAGIFVLLQGNLGSHHSLIDPKVFRGFAIADDLAPFLVINDYDAAPAWSFTLLHETVHLLLGQTGFGGRRTKHRVEHFCDAVASEFLLPAPELRDSTVGADIENAGERIARFADERNLSRTMVAYRMVGADLLDWVTFSELDARWRREWLDRHRSRQHPGGKSSGGPNFYTVRRHRLGSRLAEIVRTAMAAGELSTTRAARILDVKPRQVELLLG